MKALNGFYRLVRETYGPYFPSSKAKKESFLEKVRDKVAHYKPRMEEICDINMGDVHVKDFNDWIGDFARDRLQEEFKKYIEKEGKEPSRFMEGVIASPILTGRVIAEPLIWLFANAWGVNMKHYNSSIYVPFYFMNRFMDIDFQRREKRLDQTVVHELSHKLWYSLGGDGALDSHKNQRVWNEGFATYCADIYFANLYPDDFQANQGKRVGVHGRGKEKVKELVEKHGKDIILEVPKRWNEFNTLPQQFL